MRGPVCTIRYPPHEVIERCRDVLHEPVVPAVIEVERCDSATIAQEVSQVEIGVNQTIHPSAYGQDVQSFHESRAHVVHSALRGWNVARDVELLILEPLLSPVVR